MPRLPLPCLLSALLAAPATGVAAEEPDVRLTSREAVYRALQHNLSLKLERLDPALTNAAEQTAAAVFHPVLVSGIDVAGSPGSVSQQRVGLAPTSSTSVGGDVGVRKQFSIGTTVEGNLSSSALFGGGRGGLDPAYQSGVNLAVRQSLLQGISRRANESALATARLDRKAAGAQLRRQAELVAADTLKAYWDLRAAVAKVAIQQLALKTTEATLHETDVLIGAGKLPASERASADYAVQVQRRAKVKAEQELENVRDRMARLIGLIPPGSLATPQIVPVSSPRRERHRWTLAELQRQALAQRGDYEALKIETQIRRIDEQAAQHRLLPKLDLVAGLQLTGLSGESDASASGTAAGTEEYEQSYWSSFVLDRVGWSAGLTLEVPLGNAEARAKRDIAALQVKRALLTEEVAVQALSLELNVAWRAVQVARQQLRLSEEAARVAEAKLTNETARYKAGKITAHILSTVQAEAITERLTREQALADLVKAAVDMQAAAGVLLARLKIDVNGEVRR
jgi:outer membrane protein TolC